MLLNYLKLSLRLLARNPFFTVINVIGLSVGFAVFFILWPFAQSELASDRFMKDHDNIKRIFMDWRWTDNKGDSWGQETIADLPAYVATDLESNPQVNELTRFIPQFRFWEGSTGLRSELVVAVEGPSQHEVFFKEEHAICGDANVLTFFSIPLLKGDSKTALKSAESVALSQKVALKYFGQVDPIGKLIKVNGKAYAVTAVFEDLPSNSHLQFDIAFSNSAVLSRWNSMSGASHSWSYLYCKTTLPIRQLATFINSKKNRYPGEDFHSSRVKIEFLAQPLKEIAFSENFVNDSFIPKSRFILIVLAVVSVVVLIMAWMNYINLAISRTNSRFKEIAARKVSGAKAGDLLIQFICQSALMNVLAVFVGLTVIQLVRQPFFDFFKIRILTFSQVDYGSLLFILGLFLTGILVTAVYPALEVMRHSTRQLISKHRLASKRIIPSIFTTFQYVAALILIAWILVVFIQLDFILNKDLGLNKDHVIVIDSPVVTASENKLRDLVRFVDEIKTFSAVEAAALSYVVVGDKTINSELRRTGDDTYFGMDSNGGVDENFIPLHQIRLLAGRNFVKDERQDAVIISQYSADRLGYHSPQEAIGQHVELNIGNQMLKGVEIIGVIADYRTAPFHVSQNNTQNVSGRGQCLTYLDHLWSRAIPQRISIKVNSHQIENLVPRIEKLYGESFPGNVFHWYFLDDHINGRYVQQKVVRNQTIFFTLLAVGVACLGLLGMISNKAVEKTKEIGVRKVLGAEVHHLASLMLATTGKQVLIAIVIGMPVAWELSERYKMRFTDQIPHQWWHYVLPAAILVAILLGTTIFTLAKAVKTNPVEALKHE